MTLPIERDLEAGLAWLTSNGSPNQLAIATRVGNWKTRAGRNVPSWLAPHVAPKVHAALGLDELAGFLVTHAAMHSDLRSGEVAAGVLAVYETAFSVARTPTPEEAIDRGFLRSVSAGTHGRTTRRIAPDRATWPAVALGRLLAEQVSTGARPHPLALGACAAQAIAQTMLLSPNPPARLTLGRILVEELFETSVAPALRRVLELADMMGSPPDPEAA